MTKNKRGIRKLWKASILVLLILIFFSIFLFQISKVEKRVKVKKFPKKVKVLPKDPIDLISGKEYLEITWKRNKFFYLPFEKSSHELSSLKRYRSAELFKRNGNLIVRFPKRGLGFVFFKYGKPKLSVVVDDLGYSMEKARLVLSIDEPVTVSVFPHKKLSRKIAKMAKEKGFEVLLHLPMEPEDSINNHLEPDTLFVSMGKSEIQRIVSKDINSLLPFIDGINNHMGSKFTSCPEKMGYVFEVLKKNGLFFLDSMTSPRSCGYKLARKMGVLSFRSDLFLDKDPKYYLSILSVIAVKRGYAIGICHPKDDVILNLKKEMKRLKKLGIRFVRLGDLILEKNRCCCKEKR